MQEERMIFVIDMINGFVKVGVLADPTILKIVPTIKEIINEKKGVLVEVLDCHNKDSIEFKSFPTHCLKGTKESETCDELQDILKDSYKFYKNSTSALFSKGLIELILKKQPKEIIITGCCTDICIMNFAIPLKNLFNELGLDITITVYKEAVDTYDNPNHQREYYNEIAHLLMQQAGINVKSWNKEKEEQENNKGYMRKKVLNYGK